MDLGNHILDLLKTLAGDPTTRVRALALASAATVVIAIIRDAWSIRSQVNNRAAARIEPLRGKNARRSEP